MDDEVGRNEASYRLCYVRGPEAIIVEVAEQISRGLGRPPTASPASVVISGQDRPAERRWNPGSWHAMPLRGATGPTIRWEYLASAWCAVFAVLHVFWALGGDIGLAESAGVELATRRPMMFVLVGLWGVAALLLVGAVFAGALARPRPRDRLRRPAILTGLLVGTALLVRGVGIELILLLDTGEIASSVGPTQTRWSLLLWNPWFILGGVAFLYATYRFARLQPEGPAP